MNTYDELKEKASKGPFDMKLTPEGYYIDDKDGKPIAWEVGTLNAQLIAHTLNHFDKLMEALEEIVSQQEKRSDTDYELGKRFFDCVGVAEKALKEAKEVQA